MCVEAGQLRRLHQGAAVHGLEMLHVEAVRRHRVPRASQANRMAGDDAKVLGPGQREGRRLEGRLSPQEDEDRPEALDGRKGRLPDRGPRGARRRLARRNGPTEAVAVESPVVERTAQLVSHHVAVPEVGPHVDARRRERAHSRVVTAAEEDDVPSLRRPGADLPGGQVPGPPHHVPRPRTRGHRWSHGGRRGLIGHRRAVLDPGAGRNGMVFSREEAGGVGSGLGTVRPAIGCTAGRARADLPPGTARRILTPIRPARSETIPMPRPARAAEPSQKASRPHRIVTRGVRTSR